VILLKIKITSRVREEFQENLKELFSMIKMLNQNKVIVIGLYNNKFQDALTTSRINAIIRDISLSNDFTFVDITDITNQKDYYLDKSSYYLNYEGHKAIYKEIKKII